MNKLFVVYKITYIGDRCPPYYIGSTSKNRIESGYKGSVSSSKWKEIYNVESKKNPNLYSYEILFETPDRKIALAEELRIQKENDVVKSCDYVNESFATVDGFFGRDVSGENNPMFGVSKSSAMLTAVSESNRGKVTVSSDDGNTWYKISSEEYRKNKHMYTVPYGKYNENTAIATRSRVANGTHHFCDPEVQRAIQEKRKITGIKFTEEGLASISRSMKKLQESWANRRFHGKEFLWLRCFSLYDVYVKSHFANNPKSKTRRLLLKEFECLYPDMKDHQTWMLKIINKFKNWNPYDDAEYCKWIKTKKDNR